MEYSEMMSLLPIEINREHYIISNLRPYETIQIPGERKPYLIVPKSAIIVNNVSPYKYRTIEVRFYGSHIEGHSLFYHFTKDGENLSLMEEGRTIDRLEDDEENPITGLELFTEPKILDTEEELIEEMSKYRVREGLEEYIRNELEFQSALSIGDVLSKKCRLTKDEEKKILHPIYDILGELKYGNDALERAYNFIWDISNRYFNETNSIYKDFQQFYRNVFNQFRAAVWANDNNIMKAELDNSNFNMSHYFAIIALDRLRLNKIDDARFFIQFIRENLVHQQNIE